MNFHEKLDFLLRITGVSNSALGRRVNLDPSYISRLRRGQRSPIKDGIILTAMSDYFARYCEADYQRSSISSALRIDLDYLDRDEISSSIRKWLITEEATEGEKTAKGDSGLFAKSSDTGSGLNDGIATFYGASGKRRIAKDFLLEVLKQSRPRTLLLYSDESTDWMTADKAFAEKWARLMGEVLEKGNRIKVIHTVSRDLDEMLNAIRQWMPLYMTGRIKPYYYPKKRDGVFKHTMFIASGVAAAVSYSAGNTDSNDLSLFIKDVRAIDAQSNVFYQFLKQCKPLMNIFTEVDDKLYYGALREFESESHNTIIQTGSLSLATMPGEVLQRIITRNNIEASAMVKNHEKRKKAFRNDLKVCSYMEIIPIFDRDFIWSNKVVVPFYDYPLIKPIHYEGREYVDHLQNILMFAENYRDFRIKLVEGTMNHGLVTYIKEDRGAIIARTTKYPVMLVINESNLTAALWDSLTHIVGEKPYQDRGKDEEVRNLKNYIDRIKV